MPPKKKVKKSVERTKEDKSINKGNVTASKSSKGSQNQNVNKQSVQIIFPSDMELRKVKKRKKRSKPKKDTERDQLIAELKQELDEYDAEQQQAQQKNIQIPSNLGLPSINASELKSNDQIRLYIKDVGEKLQKLKELVNPQQGQTQQGIQQSMITRPALASLPAIQQRPIYPTDLPPQYGYGLFPPQGQTPQGTQPNRLPSQTLRPISGAGSSAPVDPKLQALQQIAKETQQELQKEGVDTSSISPPSTARSDVTDMSTKSFFDDGNYYVRTPDGKDGSTFEFFNADGTPFAGGKPFVIPSGFGVDSSDDRANIEGMYNEYKKREAEKLRLERLKNMMQPSITLPSQERPTPPSTTPSTTPRQDSPREDLQLTKTTINVSGQPQTIEAPAGFADQVKKILKYQGDIIFNAEERPKGYYHIPISKMQNIIRERELLSDDYSEYMQGLSEQQLAYIYSRYSPIDQRLRKLLMEEPKETLKFVFDKQGRPYNDITQAGEKPKIESDTEKALASGKSLKDPFIDEEVKLITKKIKDLTAKYKSKSVAYQTAIGLKQIQPIQNLKNDMTELDKMNKDLQDSFQKLPDDAQALTGVSFENATQDYTVLRGLISDYENVLERLQSDLSQKDKLFTDLNASQVASKDPVGYIDFKGRDAAVEILKEYATDDKKTYSNKVKTSIENVFGEPFLGYLQGRTKDDKKTIINQALQDVGNKSPQQFSSEFFKLTDEGKTDTSFLDTKQMTRDEWLKKHQAEEAEAKRQASLAEGHAWQYGRG